MLPSSCAAILISWAWAKAALRLSCAGGELPTWQLVQVPAGFVVLLVKIGRMLVWKKDCGVCPPGVKAPQSWPFQPFCAVLKLSPKTCSKATLLPSGVAGGGGGLIATPQKMSWVTRECGMTC